VLRELGVEKPEDCFAVIALIAHHHGNLPNFDDLLSTKQCEALLAFLGENPTLPISEFLGQWLPHASFDILAPHFHGILKKTNRFPFEHASLSAPLDTFLETQWSFAALIEADKRDAGDNKFLARCEELEKAREHFAPRLRSTLELLQSQPSQNPALDEIRTQIRHDALEKLRAGLQKKQRTFSLTAPTGAGKTFMLLALADEIRRFAKTEHNRDCGVIYGLPFLSITEQVESVCRQTFADTFPVTRMDSKSINARLEELQKQLDNEPQKLDELLREKFSEATFDRAFIVTTFVQIFEALLSNRNAQLLKLPNFANAIFLLDEIQALPPRLYSFFAAHLQAFCEKFDCYAIFSTATMPALNFADKKLPPPRDPRILYREYSQPEELAGAQYFDNAVFNRYQIRRLPEWEIKLDALAEAIVENDESCLVVLNTIDDTLALYDLLQAHSEADEVFLLNTRFTPLDRREKLATCKERLENGERIILISTQLIEAGVDIDFPVVFRDLCPLPNLVQCAGRCNRNGKLESNGQKIQGTIWFFELIGENGKSRAKLIYDESDSRFAREEIPDEVQERELLKVQQKHFESVRENLSVGQWSGGNFIEQINKLAFHDIGKFRLIDKQYGEEVRYYISKTIALGEDDDWQLLREISQSAPQRNKSSYADYQQWQAAVQGVLRRMGERVVGVRLKKTDKELATTETIFGLRYLANECDYSFDTGLAKNGDAPAFF
jgi:CRISPR-associated endonuclease/helicase Cas3